jgi:hypothetical protein
MRIEIYYNDYNRRYEVAMYDQYGRMNTLTLSVYMRMMRTYRHIMAK